MPSARGSREPQPLGRHERSGKARQVGPEARRPPSDHKAEKPSWKGWLMMHKFLSGLLAGVALLIAAPGALAADCQRAGRGDGRHARASNDRHDRTAGRSPRTATPPTPAPRPAPGRRARARGDGDWARPLGHVRRWRDPDHQGRAPRLRRGRPVRHLLGVLGQLPPRLRAARATLQVADGRRRAVLRELLRERAPSRRRCGSPRCPRPSQPGQAFDVRVVEIAVTYARAPAPSRRGARERARP